jgi:hypothetical protein
MRTGRRAGEKGERKEGTPRNISKPEEPTER